MIKVLNLYAGIGGNRKLWKDVEVTAVERDKQIAKIYQDFFPNDTVVTANAHKFLIENYYKYDFIWSSPPCPTHSTMRYLKNNCEEVKKNILT
jgi:DNA (cytosine-5)-methyltransferase 1